MEKKKTATMSDDLKGWGVGLLVMGGLHFFIPVLEATWGIALIVLGVLCLAINHRGMFIALGGCLIFVGLMNIAGGIAGGSHFWSLFGCFQIYWGIKEMVKFGKYETVHEEEGTEEITVLDAELRKQE